MKNEELLKIWDLVDDQTSVALNPTAISNEWKALDPIFEPERHFSCLLANNWIRATVYNTYVLTDEGLAIRKTLGSYKIVAPQTQQQQFNDHTQWSVFRRLLSYYIDCIKFQEVSQEAFWLSDIDTKLFIPNLDYNWLPRIDEDPQELKLIIPSESKVAHNILLQRNDEDEMIYLGYPVEYWHDKNKDPRITPIGLIPVNIRSSTNTTLTIELLLQDAQINQNWLKYNIGLDKDRIMNAILRVHAQDKWAGCVDIKEALPFIEKYSKAPVNAPINPNDLSNSFDISTLNKKNRSLCNTPILFVGAPLKYAKTLKRELTYIRDQVTDDILDKTALAHVFRNTPIDTDQADLDEVALPFISSNHEQLKAVENSLRYPVSRITGPPGTGKSQVAVNLIANLLLRDKSVLFTSKNHRAVHAISERSASLLPSGQFPLVNFCSDIDATVDNPWYKQDLNDILVRALQIDTSHLASLLSKLKTMSDIYRDMEKEYENRPYLLQKLGELQEKEESLLNQLNDLLGDSDSFSKLESHTDKLGSCLGHLYRRAKKSWFLKQWWNDWQWKKYGKQKHDEAKRFLKEYFPALADRYFNSFDKLENDIHSILEYYQSYQENSQKIRDIAIDAASMRSVKEGTEKLRRLEKDWRKHLCPTLEKKLARRISALKDNQKLVQDISAGMKFLQTANSPFFFSRKDHQIKKKAEETFKTFSQYSPAWACTLLSLTKASPCLPALFDTVIIDEASQCDIAPIIPALFRAKKFVAIGDPKQFPPITKVSNNSFMLMRYQLMDPEYLRFDYTRNTAYDMASVEPILLLEHFRCHYDIAKYANETYYGGRLCIRTDNETVGSNHPICLGIKPAINWIDVPDSEQDEIQEVKERIKLLVKNKYTGSVGIISPLKLTANRLEEELMPLMRELVNDDYKIGTVNGYQGGEKDLIFLVLGYTSNLTKGQAWYIESDDNRYIYNVASTRAKSCLIIVGDKKRCETSSQEALRRLTEYPKPPKKSDKEFDSIWERRFYKALLDAGIQTIPQRPLSGRRLDLALETPYCKIDIEVDGKAYHLNRYGERKADDIRRDMELEAQGWLVERFWVHELKDNMGGCVNRIKSRLEEAKQNASSTH